MKDTCFINWLILMIATIFLMYWLWQYGIVYEVVSIDKTHMSSVIVGYFCLCSAFLGCLSYKCARQDVPPSKYSLRVGWRLATLCMGLGLLGTTLGYTLMNKAGFSGITVGNPMEILKAISTILPSSSTSLYNTAVGISAYIILYLQCTNLEYFLHVRKDKP